MIVLELCCYRCGKRHCTLSCFMKAFVLITKKSRKIGLQALIVLFFVIIALILRDKTMVGNTNFYVTVKTMFMP